MSDLLQRRWKIYGGNISDDKDFFEWLDRISKWDIITMIRDTLADAERLGKEFRSLERSALEACKFGFRISADTATSAAD
jgi:hypothetical protein